MARIKTATRHDPVAGVERYTYPDFSEEIQRGMDFLDKESRGWMQRIDPDTLTLSQTGTCVLGQTFSGHYDEGVGLLADRLDRDRSTVFSLLAADYGFNIPSEESAESAHFRGNISDEERSRFTEEALALEAWALAYVREGGEAYDRELEDNSEIDAVLWSALTEQWIVAVNNRLNDAPVLLDLPEDFIMPAQDED